jgi:hypothetical protein
MPTIAPLLVFIVMLVALAFGAPIPGHALLVPLALAAYGLFAMLYVVRTFTRLMADAMGVTYEQASAGLLGTVRALRAAADARRAGGAK